MAQNYMSKKPATAVSHSPRLGVISSFAFYLIAMPLLLTGCFDGSRDEPSIGAANPNLPPVANAGDDQNVSQFSVVVLDGSGSSDDDVNPCFGLEGDELAACQAEFINGGLVRATFDWVFLNEPAGSTAVIEPVCVPLAGDPDPLNPDDWVPCDPDSTTQVPVRTLAQFTPDVTGVYQVEMTINDFGSPSLSDTDDLFVSVSASANAPPTADAGPDQPGVTYNAVDDTVVHLDGTGSDDPDGDPLTYAWAITNFDGNNGIPPAVPPVFADTDTATPTLTIAAADQVGEYTIELTVNDGEFDDSDTVIITVTKDVPVASVLFGSGLLGFIAIGWHFRRHKSS